jgi:uncharacterized protein YdiU (UPF0061 family)
VGASIAEKLRACENHPMPLALTSPYRAALPGDRSGDRRSRPTPGVAWASASPTPVASPRFVAIQGAVCELLSLARADVESTEMLEILSGNRVAPGSEPFAMAYGGHQFGNWAGQLGDGRAIVLGTHTNAQGERFDLQLKGAGPTAYSRRADGRAVLRSSLREFVCSEAMHALGIPTTRALSLVLTGDRVVRDMFYDGRPEAEPGAIVCRVSPSFVRFGHFELPRSAGDLALLRALADHTIEAHFPDAAARAGEERYASFFLEVAERTARLVVEWMRVGFVHGVLNTDNMSILGLTLDYGPYGFVEDFDPAFTPNTTDAQGRRYRYGAQPAIGAWNVERLAVALAPLFSTQKPLYEGIDAFARVHDASVEAMLSNKLGLDGRRDDDDGRLAADLFALLHEAELDMTIAFRRLAHVDLEAPSLAPLEAAAYRPEALAKARPALDAWLRRYASRASANTWSPERRVAAMNASNPRIVFRNYLAQEAIDAITAGEPPTRLEALLAALARPYADDPEVAAFDAPRPEWARNRPGCSMLSCSS